MKTSFNRSRAFYFATAGAVFGAVGYAIWGPYVGLAFATYVVLIGIVWGVLSLRSGDQEEFANVPLDVRGPKTESEPPPEA